MNLLDDPEKTEQFLIQNMSLKSSGVRFLIHSTTFNKSSILSLLFANPNISSIFLNNSTTTLLPSPIIIPSHTQSTFNLSSIITTRKKKSIEIPVLPLLDSLFPALLDQVGPDNKKTPIFREGLIYQVLRNESFNASLLQQFTRKSLPPGSVENLAIALKAGFQTLSSFHCRFYTVHANSFESANKIFLYLMQKILLNNATVEKYICGNEPGLDSVIQCDFNEIEKREECESELEQLKLQYCRLNRKQKTQISDFIFEQTSVVRISQRVSCRNMVLTIFYLVIRHNILYPLILISVRTRGME